MTYHLVMFTYIGFIDLYRRSLPNHIFDYLSFHSDLTRDTIAIINKNKNEYKVIIMDNNNKYDYFRLNII